MQTDEAMRSRAAAAEEFLRIPGVHGVGLGGKTVAGKPTGELAIIVLTDRKRPIRDVAPSERIPDHFRGLPTDVVCLGRAVPDADSTRYRPLQGGCQIVRPDGCNCSNGVGTMGCICLDTTDNNAPSILTNNHVLADISDGGRVYQPTAECNCCDSCPNVIAFKTRGCYTETVDGAIAKIKSGVKYTDEIVELGTVTGTYNLTLADAQSGTYAIRKYGRTTGLTEGTLLCINATRICDGRTFKNQVVVRGTKGEDFSSGGDSGSVYVNDAMQIVALHHCGNKPDQPDSGTGYPIADVLSELEIQIYVSSDNTLMPGPGQPDALEELALRVERDLVEATASREFVTAMRRHVDEITALASTNRRLLATWRHNEGRRIYDAYIRVAQDPESIVPPLVGDRPTELLLDKIVAEVLRSGSAPLRVDVLRALPKVRTFIGRRYPEALEILRRERLTLQRTA